MTENPDKQNKLSELRQEIEQILNKDEDLKKIICQDQNLNDFFQNYLETLKQNSVSKNYLNSSDSDDENEDSQKNEDTNSNEKSPPFSKFLEKYSSDFSKLSPELKKYIQEKIESDKRQDQDNTNQFQEQQQEIPEQISMNEAEDESEAPNIEVELLQKTFPRRWNINTFTILLPSVESQYKPSAIPTFSSESENENSLKKKEETQTEKEEKKEEEIKGSEKLNKPSRSYMRIDLSSLHFEGLPPGVHSDLRLSSAKENSTKTEKNSENSIKAETNSENSTKTETNSTKTEKNSENSIKTTNEKSNNFANNFKANPSPFGISSMREQMETMINRLNIDKNLHFPSQTLIQKNTKQIKEQQQNEVPVSPMDDPNYFEPPNKRIILPEFSFNETSSDDAVETPKESTQTQQQPQQNDQVFNSEQINLVADRFINTLSQKFGNQISNDRYAQLIAQLGLQQKKLQLQQQANQQTNQQPQQQANQQINQLRQQQTNQQPQQQSNQQTIQPVQQQTNQSIQQQQQPSQKIQQQPVQQQPVQQFQTSSIPVHPYQRQPISMPSINQQYSPVQPASQSFVQLKQIQQQQAQVQPAQQKYAQYQQQMPNQFAQFQQQQQQQPINQAIQVPSNYIQQPNINKESLNQMQKSQNDESSETDQFKLLKQKELEKARQDYFQHIQHKQYEKQINIDRYSTDVLNKQTEKLFGNEGEFNDLLKNGTDAGADLFKQYPSGLNKFLKFVPKNEPKMKQMIELKGVIENGSKANST